MTNKNSEQGFAHFLVLLSAIGLITFLALGSIISFKNVNLASIFPKGFVFAASDGITPGNLKLSATYNSIGIELLFTDDANANAKANLEFRKKSQTEWRTGLPLWRVSDIGQTLPSETVSKNESGFYGSALLLDPQSDYEIKVTVEDPDGGSKVLTGEISTREDTVPLSANLTPTHFIKADGNDNNDGLSEATAWKTVEKAIKDAPTNAIVRVAPGFYQAPTSIRTTPITLIAQNPALDDNRQVSNNAHSVIEPSVVSSPQNSSDPNDPNKGVWQEIKLTAKGYTENNVSAGNVLPDAVNPNAKIWKWTNSPITNATQMGYASTRDGITRRVVNWRGDIGTQINTPEGWAEKLLTNSSYNYGFFALNKDLYLRLPKDINPNSIYIKASAQNGFDLKGDGIRISGFVFQNFQNAVILNHQAHRVIIDHNLFSGFGAGVRMTGQSCATFGSTCQYGSDHLIEQNAFLDSSLRSLDQANEPTVPWKFIKSGLTNANGSWYAGRVGHFNESAGVSGAGGAQQVVIRKNTFKGSFDAVSDYHPKFDKYAASNMDLHDNLMQDLADDPVDQSRGIINLRIWNNRIENTYTALSLGPLQYGPVFYFKNQLFNTGGEGITADNTGTFIPGTLFIKYSGSSIPTAKIWIVHNTFWTNNVGNNGGAEFADSGNSEEALVLRNNLLRTTRKVFIPSDKMDRWNEDYNHLVTSNATYGLEVPGKGTYKTNVSSYRTATGQGAHTNVAGDFVTASVLDNGLVNALQGDFSLTPTSPFIDAGTPVPNISDRVNTDYKGSAPDIGACESGDNCLAKLDGSFATLRIDAAATSSRKDSFGNNWVPDRNFVGGETVDRGPITMPNSQDSWLYQTERFGMSGYNFNLPPGIYKVLLHFAETYWRNQAVGKRVFSVNVEGTKLDNFDIFAETGALNKAVVKNFPVQLTDGELNITFTKNIENPLINGLEIMPLNCQTAADSLKKDLVSYWKFDEPSVTTAADSSVNGKNLGLNNALWTQGYLNGAVTFNGTTGSYGYGTPQTGASGIAGDNFGVIGWVKTNASTLQSIYSEGDTATNTPRINLVYDSRTSNSTLTLEVVDAANKYIILRKPVNLHDGNWHQVGASRSGNSFDLIVDGKRIISNTATIGSFGTMRRVTVGAYGRVGYSFFFNGQIDDLRTYKRALTEEDLMALYNQGKGCAN